MGGDGGGCGRRWLQWDVEADLEYTDVGLRRKAKACRSHSHLCSFLQQQVTACLAVGSSEGNFECGSMSSAIEWEVEIVLGHLLLYE